MAKSTRFLQRFENYEKAFLSLKESVEAFEKEKENLFIRDSLIQRYEYTIELAWKCLKDYLNDDGFKLSAPKDIIRQAWQQNYITKGELWLKALDDRNLTSHAYDAKMVSQIVEDIEEKYFLLLQDLYTFFK